MILLSRLLLLLLWSHTCLAVYFDLVEGKQQCFYEDLEPEESVIVYYSCADLNPENRRQAFYNVARQQPERYGQGAKPHDHVLGVNVVVADPEGFLIHQETLSKESDAFDFNALELPGEHSICFQSNTSHWWDNEKFKFYIDIQTGIDVKYSENPWLEPAGAIDEMLDLQKKAEALKGKMKEVQENNAYMVQRDARFRQTSASTYQRVMWASVIQVGLLVGTALLQLQGLKWILITKKLV